MIKFEIIKITTKGNVILSWQGKPICTEEPIWQRRAGNQEEKGSMRPAAAAFVINNQNPAELEITVHIMGLKVGVEYRLVCLFDKRIVLFSGSAKVSDANREVVVFKMVARSEPEEFFKVSGQELSWRITGKKNSKTSAPNDADLELYWLYDYDSEFFEQGWGIPVEILRELAQACGMPGKKRPIPFNKKKGKNNFPCSNPEILTKEEIIAAVVKSRFETNPPRYDISGINNGQFVSKADGINNYSFHLDSYLKVVNDPKDTTCDCYDQAAVVQYYLRVIGINNVLYCEMNRFGYLKLTRLIGRGLCNNPFYGKDQSCPVVDEMDEERTYFEKHAFCYLKDYGWVLDSCVGPHTGSENPCQYVDNVVDKRYPVRRRAFPGKTHHIECGKGVTEVNRIVSSKKEPKAPLTEAFMECVTYSDNINKNILEKFVVCQWPDPRECPGLSRDEWTLSEEIIPGTSEVMKTLNLRKNLKTINIKLYVSSAGNSFSLNRFLAIGSFSNLHDLPYKEGPEYLGHYSAQIAAGKHRRCFWIFHNLVFDIYFENVTIKVEKALVKWLDELAKSHVKDKISREDLPSGKCITCSNKKVKVNETMTINVGVQNNLVYDFNLEGGGLQLIDEKDTCLCFKALKKSDNKLVILLVDKSTLLLKKKKFNISVEEN